MDRAEGGGERKEGVSKKITSQFPNLHMSSHGSPLLELSTDIEEDDESGAADGAG